MNWYLAEITNGIDVEGLQTGRHVHICRMPTGVVRVIGARGITAVVKVEEARRRVRVVKDAAGRPVKVRGQVRREAFWNERREARRFYGGPVSKLVA
jgi:hypothetical protein